MSRNLHQELSDLCEQWRRSNVSLPADPNKIPIMPVNQVQEILDAIPEQREHKEGCCTNSDGTWSESQECDAQCWCHIPIPSSGFLTPRECNCEWRRERNEAGHTIPACPIHGSTLYPPVTTQDIARTMEIPEEVVEAPPRMCNCSERQAKWDRGETAPACPIHGANLWPVKFADEIDEETTYDPRAAGTVYPNQPVAKAQKYILHGLGKTQFGDAASNRCEACGCLVGDKIQHDVWHSKTRSEV